MKRTMILVLIGIFSIIFITSNKEVSAIVKNQLNSNIEDEISPTLNLMENQRFDVGDFIEGDVGFLAEDTTTPVINLTGDSTVYVEYEGTYLELGATYTDDVDPSGDAVVGGDTVDPTILGTYIVTYNITDSNGNVATEITRTVIVQDTTIPVITLTGDSTIYVEYDESHTVSEQVVQISASAFGTFVLTDQNKIYGTGDGIIGLLGENYISKQNTFVDISYILNLEFNETIENIAAGLKHIVVTTSHNRVLTWGDNTNGQLGDNTNIRSYQAIDITSNFNFHEDETITSIEAYYYNMLVTSEGRVFTWGRNDAGQLGDGTKVSRKVPIDITEQFDLSETDKIVFVSGGYWSSAAISLEGRVFTWGYNASYQLANGTSSETLIPLEITNQFDIDGSDRIIGITIGGSHGAAFSESGRVFTWGTYSYLIGDGSVSNRSIPYEITTNFNFESGDCPVYVFARWDNVMLLTENGQVYGWGANSFGMVGNGETAAVSYPMNVTNRISSSETDDIIQIHGSGGTVVALSTNGIVFTWGNNPDGQLGNGTFVNTLQIYVPEIIFTVSDAYIELGATYTDNYDPDGNASVGGDTVDASVLGTYIITYNITDSNGNEAIEVTRTVIVQSVSFPYISLTGNSTVYVEYEETYSELGATYRDDVDPSGDAVVGGDTVDPTILGTYIITYNFTDSEGNVANEAIRTVIVQDSTVPIITLTGDTTVYVEAGSNYIELGATFTDNYDSPGFAVVGGDTVDTYISGTYTITYNITDSEGNEAVEVTRTVIVRDTTSPVITLIGDSVMYIEAGSNYTELGATYTDNFDASGDAIIGGDTVDPTILGTYIVTYNIIDSNGNDAVEVTRTVIVQDSTIPVITLTGNSTIYVEYEGTYSELGATYTDDVDPSGDAIVGGDAVNTTILGTYFVNYNITDSEGNVAIEEMRTVIVRDTTIPVITLTGDLTVYVEYEGIYSELGATFTDNYDGSGDAIIGGDTVDSGTLGTYIVTYNITDSNGNIAVEVTRTVIVQDSALPVISLTGDSTVYVDYEGTYSESGATYTDDIDPSGVAVVGGDTVDSSTLGIYTVTYNFTDSEGNVAVEVTRTVIVRDTKIPVITLTGDLTVYVEYEGIYSELGATYTDNYDASGDAIIGGDTVDSGTLGTYIVTYNITDSNGNEAVEVTRRVIVQDSALPVITLTGNSTVYVEYEGTYSELGATYADDVDPSGDAVVGGKTVNTFVLGTYIVTYNFTDSEGNEAVEVTRTVIVRDTTIPVINLTGNSTIYVEYEGIYSELGATFTDNYDVLGDAVVGGDTVDTYTLGTYTVAYNITDSNGNVAVEVTRTVIVQDSTLPVISLTGDSTVYVEYEGTYLELGATYTDDVDPSGDAIVGGDTVDSSTLGTYIITYNIIDGDGNIATEVTRTVIVRDTTIPVINLTGNSTIYVETGSNYTELGATYTDNFDASGDAIIGGDTVNPNILGTYIVTYSITDSNGNDATEVTRRVIIQDSAIPVIALTGDSTVYVEYLGTYSELGATYTDDTDPSGDAIVDGDTVDPTILGTYIVTYNITDSEGNVAIEVTRTVIIQDTTIPVISLTGDSTVYVEYEESYSELGATFTDNYDPDGNAIVGGDTVDSSILGTYTVTYNFTDSEDNVAIEVTRTVIVQDTKTPVITLTGDSTVYVEVGSSYTELGATYTDDVDLSGDAVVGGDTVNTSVLGIYTVTYNFTDSDGNVATEVTRTVIVQDTRIPVISLTGDSTVYVEAGSSYTELGATYIDDVDPSGDAIVGGDTVDTTILGTYIVTYNIIDSEGNVAIEVTRTVIVQDLTPPVITPTGNSTVYVEYEEPYTENGATFTDNYDGSGDAIIGGDTVDTTILGTYTVTYNITDSEGNVATEVMRTVIVQDTTVPVITLTGDSTIYVEARSSYTELGATYTDNYDLLGYAVVGGDTVNTTILGTYIVTYNITDSEGNVATEVTRTVIVRCSIPVITLTGDSTVYVEAGSNYTELGAKYTDDVDLSGDAVVGGDTVDPTILGTYIVTYNFTDNEGNVAVEVTRTVIVQDTITPVITLTGASTVYIEYEESYSELGATYTDDVDPSGDAIVGGDTVDTSVLGTYTITYNFTDSDGNVANEVTRTVIVQDTTIPVISLTGNSVVYVEVGSSYTELGATYTDDVDPSGDAVVGGDTVDTYTLGTYIVTYNITDSDGHVAVEVTRRVIVRDTTIPVITLTGNSTVYVEYEGTYSELGATYTDDVDPSGYAIVGGDTVDTYTLGTYIVTYNITDSDGNIATEVTRRVIVQDTTIPVISLTGSSVVYVEAGSSYTELGATYTDDVDLSGDAVVGGETVNINMLGTYIVTYNITDSDGNIATEVTRRVIVRDTTIPVITLTGNSTVYVEYGGTYSELGATYTDDVDPSGDAVVGGDTVNTTILGTYFVTYNITDSDGNVATAVTRRVIVQDTTIPVISLTGNSTVYVEYEGTYSELGATYTDDVDLSGDAVVGGDTVDPTILGTYFVTYNITDSDGNVAVEVTRRVIVRDTTIPVITLTGNSIVYVEYEESYSELGATYTDDVDPSGNAIIGGDTVNVNMLGTYIVTYNFTDSEGNVATEVTRTVIVQDTKSPVITLTGNSIVYVEYDESYSELGATYTDDVDPSGDAIIGGDTVDSTTLGTYIITYNFIDSEGNVATEVIRTVIVQDTIAPVITLTGASTVYVEYEYTYTEQGATFTDNYDSDGVAIAGGDTVDTSILGTYIITYNITDSAGNAAVEVTRTVIVQHSSNFNLNIGETIIKVNLGWRHSSAITSEGRLFTWGFNPDGQLGDGTTTYRYIPTDITGNFNLHMGETIINVSLGGSFSSAITSEGRLFTWGHNYYGELGDGTTTSRYTPIDITENFDLHTGETIISVSLGGSFSSAITSEGRLFTWGINNFGQLGDGTNTSRYTPTDITGNFYLNPGETIVSVSAGYQHSSAITSEGGVFTWGRNVNGQLGDGTSTNSFTPKEITGNFTLNTGEKIISTALDSNHSSVLTSDGRLFTWGDNTYGQLGDGTTTQKNLPIDITNNFGLEIGEKVVSTSLGIKHLSVVTSDGRLFTWGDNTYGQLGDGTTTQRNLPIDITSNFALEIKEKVVIISSGGYRSLSITTEGRVFSWGENSFGQLGDGTTITKYTPTEITSNFNIIKSSYKTIYAISKQVNFDPNTNTIDVLLLLDYPEQIVSVLINNIEILDVTFENNILSITLPVTGISFGDHYLITINELRYDNGTIINPTGFTINNTILLDCEAPVISLIGDSTVYVEFGESYTENGATFTDNYDADGYAITGGDTINTSVLGTYTIAYTITDTNGNVATAITRTVIVQDTTKPVITLTGDSTVYVEYGESYTENGATFTDNYDSLGEVTFGTVTIIDIIAKSNHTAAITSKGMLFTWGNNTYGQLGDSTTTSSFTPIDITSNFNLNMGETITSISLGGLHSAAITSEGRVFTWGNNTYGQLGDSTTIDSSTPIDITSNFNLHIGETITSISLGGTHSSAITSEGRVFTWGANGYGQLGYGTRNDVENSIPIEITSNFNLNTDETIIDIILGGQHSLTITSEGRVFTWGYNNYGQLGDGSITDKSLPTEITSNFNLNASETVIKITVGLWYNSAITSEGRIFMWGYNLYGQLGDGTTTSKSTPTEITSNFNLITGETLIEITLGHWHTEAISSEGKVFTWGRNIFGQLGDGTTTNKSIPTNITSKFNLNIGETIIGMSFGGGHSSAISSEGRVFTWGENTSGQLGNNTTIDKSTPTEITSNFILSLRSLVNTRTLGTYTITYTATDSNGNNADEVTRTVIVQDTTKPVITLNGDTTIYMEYNGIYTEQGATFTDNYDTSGTVILGGDTVDTSSLGTYTIAYNITDPNGNIANEVVRTVIVQDTTKPVITLTGDSTIFIEYKGIYTENGSTFSDNYDTSGNAVVGGDTVDTSILGTYTVTYNTTDSNGNIATEVIRTIIVQDTTRPVITLTGDSTIYVEYKSTYTEQGATFTDNYDASGNATSGGDTVDTSSLGTYTITYNVTDTEGNIAHEVTRTVIVQDTTKPVITLTGDSTTYIEYKNTYTEQGSLFTDNYDASGNATIGGDTVDTNILGTYRITYNVTDSEGNIADEVTRTVIVQDTTKPVITLTGDSTVYVEAGSNYIEDGALYSDNYDTAGVATIGGDTVDTSILGTYTITYNVTDTNDNVAIEVTRTIIVQDTTKPVITLTGDSTVYVEAGSNYIEDGALYSDNYDTAGNATIGGDTVDTSILGTYTITYNITDTNDNVAIEVTRTIIVQDTTKPVITLIGDSTIYIEYQWPYTEQTATFTDNYDKSGDVIVSGDIVDSSVLGTYTITYNFTDSEGNIADEVTRTVIVQYASNFGLGTGKTIINITLGNAFSSSITSEGRVFTWGLNQNGILGDGTTINSSTPIDITSNFNLHIGETITSISLGGLHSAAITSEGRVFTWGLNQSGILGDGTTINSSTPIDITSNFNLHIGETITSISLGGNHSSAITSEGRVFTWGANGYGQLGYGTRNYVENSMPIEITSNFNLNTDETITNVSLGNSHSSAITSEGRIFTWGYNNYGQLGDGTTTNRYLPTEITSNFSLHTDEKITNTSSGYLLSSATTTEGRLFTWGNNDFGRLGDGTTTNRYSPTDITTNFNLNIAETISYASFAISHSAALTSEGRLFTWGYNGAGRLGDGTSTSRYSPTNITNNLNLRERIINISLAGSHSSAITSEGRVFTWGSNDAGQLGDGTTINRYTPTDIMSGFPFPLSSNAYIYAISKQVNFNTITNMIEVQLLLDYPDQISSLLINNVEIIEFTFENNILSFKIPVVDVSFGDTYLVEILELRYTSGVIVTPTGFTISNLVLIDYEAPTFGTINDQTIEVGGPDIDWTSYITNEKDNGNGLLTKIEVEDNIIYDTVGTYSVVVKLLDESLNEVSQTINVSVQDTTPPVIILTGDSTIYMEAGSVYIEYGATYSDNYDASGDAIVGGDTVDISVLGTYTITYNITDTNGNEAIEVTRKIIVQDTTKPVIRLTGDSTIYVEYEDTYTEQGAIFTDNYNESGDAIIGGDIVDISGLGTYTITYNITDTNGNEAIEVTRKVIVQDTTKPVIRLTGDSTIYIEYEGTYTEQGATFTDNYDPSGNVIGLGDTVNSNILGTYIISYNTTDTNNNIADEVTRTVIVQDTTVPVISLTGGSIVYVEYEESYTEQGATFTDNYDASGDAIVGGDTVDPSTLGTYIVSYNITDSNGNIATEVTRTVIVQDTTVPVISLTGGSIVYVEYEGTYSENGATFTDNYDVSGDAMVGGDTVDSSTLETYIITYNITDSNGNIATEVSRTVIVQDTTVPVISLTGGSIVYVEYEGTYSENGATFTDNYDASGDAMVGGDTVDSSTLETYIIKYNITDSNGNIATEATRTVIVQDTTVPVISLTGDSTVYIEYKESYIESGATFTDNYDASGDAIVGGDIVDSSTLGEYIVTYNITDSNGNLATEVTRTVIVQDTISPTFDTITNQTIEAGVSDIDWSSYITNEADNSDGTLIKIEVEDNVDYDTVGTYTVMVKLADESLNETSQIFNVTVEDTTVPTFDKIADQTIEAGVSDIDWSSYITNEADNSDGTLIKIEVEDNVDYDTVATYTVTVKLIDESLKETTQTFNVTVEDTTAPSILGLDDIEFILESTVPDYLDGISASDIVDGDITDSIVVDDSPVNYNVIGEYQASYTIIDSSGNIRVETITVLVRELTPPIITLIGDSEVTMELGNSYIEEDAICTDNYDLSCNVIVESTIDDSTPGTYLVTYTAIDSSGNVAVEVTRTVTVEDTIAPTVSLNSSLDTIYEGSIYEDTSVAYYDEDDVSITVEGIVDSVTSGTYILTYRVKDTSGNETVVKRAVTVVDKHPEILFELQDAKTSIVVGEEYVDGICSVYVNGRKERCTVQTTNIDTTIAGVYTITYSYTYNSIEYTHNRYIYVYNEGNTLTLYYRKEPEEGVIV